MEFSSKEECEKFILKSVKELGECALTYYDLYSEAAVKDGKSYCKISTPPYKTRGA